MSRPFQIEISESLEELEKALKYATSASSKERLQMLYWLKSGQVSSRQALAERLGRDEATITRWLRKYKDGGCSSLPRSETCTLVKCLSSEGKNWNGSNSS